MKKFAFAIMVTTLALTTNMFAQSPAPAEPSKVEVNVQKDAAPPVTNVDVKTAQPAAPAPAASISADVNINRTETAPAPVSTTTTEIWALDGKTVLIGGALLLGIILIAVAAAGRDRTTTVVR